MEHRNEEGMKRIRYRKNPGVQLESTVKFTDGKTTIDVRLENFGKGWWAILIDEEKGPVLNSGPFESVGLAQKAAKELLRDKIGIQFNSETRNRKSKKKEKVAPKSKERKPYILRKATKNESDTQQKEAVSQKEAAPEPAPQFRQIEKTS